ncbi:hypothetical protein [Streptomyces triticisoli]|uniref:hypothetical protein n=1 Tax=Streptomyces triticisoli TaxID=2182797 RepID=UPI000DDB8005|nr:hypothetical protein [Streptomyces triticisoli]
MPSSPDDDHPFDESAEKIRRKERELAETEVKLARREWMADRLMILRIVFALVALVTGNPVYRWADRGIEWVMEHLRESE